MRPFLYLAPLLLLLTACDKKEEAAPEATEQVGMANPAAIYCGEQGGELEIRDAELGQFGYCHLPDGRVIEEWELYRADHPVVGE